MCIDNNIYIYIYIYMYMIVYVYLYIVSYGSCQCMVSSIFPILLPNLKKGRAVGNASLT